MISSVDGGMRATITRYAAYAGAPIWPAQYALLVIRLLGSRLFGRRGIGLDNWRRAWRVCTFARVCRRTLPRNNAVRVVAEARFIGLHFGLRDNARQSPRAILWLALDRADIEGRLWSNLLERGSRGSLTQPSHS